ncbi:MAG: hypothetical protein II155_03180 [Clostridia bacterium]|nr:hypothetical protein [Clostridia bacterium]
MAKNTDPTVVLSLEKINELENIIDSSPAPRFGGNTDRRIVDIDEIYNLLGDLKVTIPEDVRKADSIINNAKNITSKTESFARELEDNAQARAEALTNEAESKKKSLIESAQSEAHSIVAEAEAEAQRIVEAAEAKREALLDEHDIIAEAERRAGLLERKAEYNAKKVYDNAKTYADGVLGSLMQFLEEYYEVVEINRNDLGVVPKPDFNHSADEAKAIAEQEEAKAREEEEEEEDTNDTFFGLFKRKKKKGAEEEEEPDADE